MNRFSNTRLLNAAVAETCGEAYLYRGSASSRHTLVGIDQWSGESLEDATVVGSVTLDDVLAPFPVVHLLKIDCEGAEYSIFNSVNDETISKVQKLVIELHGLDEDGVSDSIEERLALSFADISILKTSPKLGVLYARKL